jgi:DNA-directed RNA polymerase subunit alpha
MKVTIELESIEELDRYLEFIKGKDEVFISNPIDDLHLSVRANNCLKASCIFTVNKLLEFTESDLLANKNLSKKCVDEIVASISGYGLPPLGSYKRK